MPPLERIMPWTLLLAAAKPFWGCRTVFDFCKIIIDMPTLSRLGLIVAVAVVLHRLAIELRLLFKK